MAVRASPRGGEERAVRKNMGTLSPMKWINDSIVNFLGKVLIQLWRGRGWRSQSARVQLTSDGYTAR